MKAQHRLLQSHQIHLEPTSKNDVNAKLVIVVFCRYFTSAFWIWGVCTAMLGRADKLITQQCLVSVSRLLLLHCDPKNLYSWDHLSSIGEKGKRRVVPKKIKNKRLLLGCCIELGKCQSQDICKKLALWKEGLGQYKMQQMTAEADTDLKSMEKGQVSQTWDSCCIGEALKQEMVVVAK